MNIGFRVYGLGTRDWGLFWVGNYMYICICIYIYIYARAQTCCHIHTGSRICYAALKGALGSERGQKKGRLEGPPDAKA